MSCLYCRWVRRIVMASCLAGMQQGTFDIDIDIDIDFDRLIAWPNWLTRHFGLTLRNDSKGFADRQSHRWRCYCFDAMECIVRYRHCVWHDSRCVPRSPGEDDGMDWIWRSDACTGDELCISRDFDLFCLFTHLTGCFSNMIKTLKWMYLRNFSFSGIKETEQTLHRQSEKQQIIRFIENNQCRRGP